MNKKIVILSIFIALGALVLISYSYAASLPRFFELPTNTDLRRGDLVNFIGSLIKAALGLIGAVLLAVIVYSGFVYATAIGEEKRITKAKNTLTYAIIGIVIIAGAFILSDFIIQNIVK